MRTSTQAKSLILLSLSCIYYGNAHVAVERHAEHTVSLGYRRSTTETAQEKIYPSRIAKTFVNAICNATVSKNSHAQHVNENFWEAVTSRTFNVVACTLSRLVDSFHCDPCVAPSCKVYSLLCPGMKKIAQAIVVGNSRIMAMHGQSSCEPQHVFNWWLQPILGGIRADWMMGNTITNACETRAVDYNSAQECFSALYVNSTCTMVFLQRVLLNYGQWMVSVMLSNQEHYAPGVVTGTMAYSTQVTQTTLIGCWEPVLQAAQALYHQPGKWDVSAQCIDVLQTTSRKAISTVAHAVFDSCRKKVKNQMIRTFWSLMPALYEAFLGGLIQSMLRPVFSRFLSTAQLRNNEGNKSTVPVTCTGLRGNRQQVYRSLLQLFRLLIVNEIMALGDPSHVLSIYSGISIILPCLIHIVL
eukprot:scpid76650/ scgid24952/ 